MLIVYIGVYVLIGLIFVSNLGDLLIIDGENACLPMFLAIVFWPLILVYLVIVLVYFVFYSLFAWIFKIINGR